MDNRNTIDLAIIPTEFQTLRHHMTITSSTIKIIAYSALKCVSVFIRSQDKMKKK